MAKTGERQNPSCPDCRGGLRMRQVLITVEKLNELRMLADWQLREMGFDTASVTAACQAEDSADASDRYLNEPPTEAEIQAALDFGRTAEQHLRG